MAALLHLRPDWRADALALERNTSIRKIAISSYLVRLRDRAQLRSASILRGKSGMEPNGNIPDYCTWAMSVRGTRCGNSKQVEREGKHIRHEDRLMCVLYGRIAWNLLVDDRRLFYGSNNNDDAMKRK